MKFKYLTEKRKLNKEDRRFDTTWDCTGFLMMCIADMEIRTPEPMIKDMVKKIQEGNFVYTYLDKKMHDAIAAWYLKRYETDIACKNIIFGNGVMHLIQTAIEAFSDKGDGIIIQPPVYGPFYDVINSKERKIIKNNLIYNQKTHHYTMDFALLEKQMKVKKNKLMILCSPHNPVGRVWTKEELSKIIDLADKYNVLILSDEIWQDIIFSNYKHSPISLINKKAKKNTIIVSSLAKTYNLGSMQYGYAIVPNNDHYALLEKQLTSSIDYMSHNIITAETVKSGYTNPKCYDWYLALKEKIERDFKYIKKELEKNTDIIVTNSEGMYLVWLDMSKVSKNGKELSTRLFKAKIHCNEGQKMYGNDYWNFLRVNISDKHSVIEDLVRRLSIEFKRK